MKHICAQPIMKFYHRKYMLQKKMEGQTGAVSEPCQTGQEVPLCAGDKYIGRASFQLDGLPAQQEEI